MRLTKKQKEALEAAPLYYGQSETNLNKFYWVNGNNNKWFQPRTVDILRQKGLLAPEFDGLGGYDDSVLYRVETEES